MSPSNLSLKVEITSCQEESAGNVEVSSEGVLVVGTGAVGKALGGAPRAAEGEGQWGPQSPHWHLGMRGMDCMSLWDLPHFIKKLESVSL